MQLPVEAKGSGTTTSETRPAPNSTPNIGPTNAVMDEGGSASSAQQRASASKPTSWPARPVQNSAKMRSMIIDRIPPARRPFIDVIVLDLATGRKKESLN